MPLSKTRIESVDILRGIVMIIMALDHTRDFFHKDAIGHDPLDLSFTTPFLFFTRWITHFCAPVFVFLSGISAGLSGRNKTKAETSVFLIRRGIWLLLVEIFIVTMGFTFDPFYHVIILQVIWAIGWGMILLGLLIRTSYNVIVVIGLVIVFGHDLMDRITLPAGTAGTLVKIFLTANFYPVPFAPGHILFFIYAILPWAGLMMLGYGASVWFIHFTAGDRKRILLVAGICVTALFFALRFINGYGDPAPYQLQLSTVYTILSFLNTSKYPPSLEYMCMTIGPALMLLALLESTSNLFTSFARVYGQVPFFYYVLHFYILHTLLVLLFFASGYGSNDIVPQHNPFFFRPDHFGFDLPVVYLIWVSVVLVLYYPSRWYARYKQANRQIWWLHYL